MWNYQLNLKFGCITTNQKSCFNYTKLKQMLLSLSFCFLIYTLCVGADFVSTSFLAFLTTGFS